MIVVDQILKTRGVELPLALLQDAIVCVDSHTAGEPTRLVIGGIPEIHGRDIAEKAKFFEEDLDHLRGTLTGEPRGHAPMHAAVLTPPSSNDAHFGLILMSALGYLDMCGHALIGAVTSVLEAGLVSAEEPVTTLVIETPAGNMRVRAAITGGKVQSVTFHNQSAFVYQRDLEVEVETLGRLIVDIAYGGLWYVIVETDQIGLEIGLANLDKLRYASNLILKAVNASISVQHPQRQQVEHIPQLLFIGPPMHPEAHGRNLVTSKELGFDRSPCGTGSCAKMALLHEQGDLHVGEDYTHESILGTLFRGRLVEETEVGSFDAVIPEITGNAYLTGINCIIIDPDDPIRHGFYVW